MELRMLLMLDRAALTPLAPHSLAAVVLHYAVTHDRCLKSLLRNCLTPDDDPAIHSNRSTGQRALYKAVEEVAFIDSIRHSRGNGDPVMNSKS